MSAKLLLFLSLWMCGPGLVLAANPPLPGVEILNLLPMRPGNPRNTEGSFVTLKDGRILFAYSKFTGGGDDNAAAVIVGRFSSDGGRTWTTDDTPLVSKEGDMNVMSVSFLRLKDGRIALFYIRKNSISDCRPLVRFSRDEGKTWSEPTLCVPEEGYFVLNNDRAVQLKGGRILLPVALHRTLNGQFGSRGVAMVYYSDDAAKTWKRSDTMLECPGESRAGLQEPGVVELKDGRVMMFMRTQLGSQYLSFSSDKGKTWSPVKPSDIKSPLSPASIKRIPKTGDLLLVWNDHSSVDPSFRSTDAPPGGSGGKRTPLTVAISKDEGRTWIHARNIADDPDGWYCYIAIHFAGDRVLLGYVSGGRGKPKLSDTDIAYFDVNSLYAKMAISNPQASVAQFH